MTSPGALVEYVRLVPSCIEAYEAFTATYVDWTGKTRVMRII